MQPKKISFQYREFSEDKENFRQQFYDLFSHISKNNPHSDKFIKTNFEKIITYLCSYCSYKDDSGFKVKSSIIEDPYISEAYLRDYQNFYSISFKDISRYCLRLHFFEKKAPQKIVQDENLENFEIIPKVLNEDKLNQDSKEFWDSYIGYVVVKPLSNSLIGSTLLKPYLKKNLTNPNPEFSQKFETRYFNSTRLYEVHIGGKELQLDTLIFQEQDKAISACATVSIWTAFHKTTKLFNTAIPSPGEVTLSAGNKHHTGRILPNDGLDLNQIVRAIQNNGLVSEVISHKKIFNYNANATNLHSYGKSTSKELEDEKTPKVIENDLIRRVTYAYNKMGIPLLLGYLDNNTGGRHLTTITGYRVNYDMKLREKDKNSPTFTSDYLSKVYVHDDQLGPFSKIGFNDADNNDTRDMLKVKWIDDPFPKMEKKGNNGIWGSSDAYSSCIIVPLKPVIRLPYNQIYTATNKLNKLLFGFKKDEEMKSGLKQFFSSTSKEETDHYKDLTTDLIKETENQSFNKFVWDIYLSKSNNFKKNVYDLYPEKKYFKHVKEQVNSNLYPEHIWISSLEMLYKDGTMLPVVTFIFDARDVPRNFSFYDVLFFGKIKEKYTEAFKEEETRDTRQRGVNDFMLTNDFYERLGY